MKEGEGDLVLVNARAWELKDMMDQLETSDSIVRKVVRIKAQ